MKDDRIKFRDLAIKAKQCNIDQIIKKFKNNLDTISNVLNFNPNELNMPNEKKLVRFKTKKKAYRPRDTIGPFTETDDIDAQIKLIKSVLEEDNKMNFIEKKKKQDQLHKEMDKRHQERKSNNIKMNKELIKQALSQNNGNIKGKVNSLKNHLTMSPKKLQNLIGSREVKNNRIRIKTAIKPFSLDLSKPSLNLDDHFNDLPHKTKSRNKPSGFDQTWRTSFSQKITTVYNDIQKQCNDTVSSANRLNTRMNEKIPRLMLESSKTKNKSPTNLISEDLMKELIKDTKEYKNSKRLFIYPKNSKTPKSISLNLNNILTKTEFTDKISTISAFNIRDIINDRYQVSLKKDDILGYKFKPYDFAKRENYLKTYHEKKLEQNLSKMKEYVFQTQIDFSKIKSRLEIE
jgi:hypothetical protein